MDDIERVEIDSGFYYLPNNKSRNILRKSLPLFYMLIKIVAIDILGYDIDVRLASDSLLVFNYLRMGNNLHYFTLIIKSRDRHARKLLSADIL
jgi:hypothetical protein